METKEEQKQRKLETYRQSSIKIMVEGITNEKEKSLLLEILNKNEEDRLESENDIVNKRFLVVKELRENQEQEQMKQYKAKQEEKLTTKINDLAETKDKKRLQRLKELEYVDIIDSKDLELLFGITERSQATYRKRSKKRLPFIGGGKGGSISYSKKEVTEWNINR